MIEKRLYRVLLAPCITEKTVRLGVNNQCVFKVMLDATKMEIKAAVEQCFSVTVLSVNMLNVKPRRCQVRGRPGKRKAWKKAYITLKQGDTIGLFAEALEVEKED